MNFIRSGFRAIRSNPVLALAEIAWRWTFGAATWIVIVLTVRAIMAGVDISPVEAELAHNIDAVRIADATARILVQVLPRFVHALAIAVPMLALVWIASATIGRWATLRGLINPVRGARFQLPSSRRIVSLLLINTLRGFFAIAAFIAFFGTVFEISARTAPDVVYGAAPLLVFGWMLFGVFIGALWALVNWVFALAPIFTIRDGATAGRAIGNSLGLYRARPREYLAIASWFGLFRGAALTVAILAGLVVVAAGSVRAATVLSVVIALVYFAIADFLYIARLASYVSLASAPTEPAAVPAAGETAEAPLSPDLKLET